MHADSRGKGDAVLLIHGMPTNGRLWDGVVRELSRRHKCIVIDLPGTGNTPFLPYGPSYFVQVAAHIEQIRRRYRVQRWHVVGHDGGSAIAVQYAHLFPQRVDRLALLSPAVFPDLQPFFLLDLLRKPVLGELSAPLVKYGVLALGNDPGSARPAQCRPEEEFFQSILRYCWTLEIDAAGSGGVNPGWFFGNSPRS